MSNTIDNDGDSLTSTDNAASISEGDATNSSEAYGESDGDEDEDSYEDEYEDGSADDGTKSISEGNNSSAYGSSEDEDGGESQSHEYDEEDGIPSHEGYEDADDYDENDRYDDGYGDDNYDQRSSTSSFRNEVEENGDRNTERDPVTVRRAIIALLICCLCLLLVAGIIVLALLLGGGGSDGEASEQEPSLAPTPSQQLPTTATIPTVAPFVPPSARLPPTLPPTISLSPTIQPFIEPTPIPSEFPTSYPTISEAPTQTIPEELLVEVAFDTFLYSDGFFVNDPQGSEESMLVQRGVAGQNEIPTAFSLMVFNVPRLIEIESVPNRSKKALLRLAHVVPNDAQSRNPSTYTIVRLPETNLAVETLFGSIFIPFDGIAGPDFAVEPTDTFVEVDITSLIFDINASTGERDLQSRENQIFLMIENRGEEQPLGGDRFRTRESDESPELLLTLSRVPGLPTTLPSRTPSVFPSISTGPTSSSAPSFAPTLSVYPTVSSLPSVGVPVLENRTLGPDQDTYIELDGGSTLDSFGTESFIRIRNSFESTSEFPHSIGLVAFTIENLPEASAIEPGVGRAILKMSQILPSSASESEPANLRITRLPRISLNLESLNADTFTIREGIEGPSFAVLPTDVVVEVDISSLVFDGTFQDQQLFLLIENNSTIQEPAIQFNSRESNKPPQLTISFEESAEIVI